MQNTSIGVSPLVRQQNDPVAAYLGGENIRFDGDQLDLSALDTVVSHGDDAQSLRVARQLLDQITACPGALLTKEPTVKRLSSDLSQRIPRLDSALQWPQVNSFHDRLIRQATKPLFDSLPDDQMDAVYNQALKLLPTELLRLHAGLAVAEEISLEAGSLYIHSEFCKQADDRVENFAGGPWFLLVGRLEPLPRLSTTELDREERTRLLLTALYPSFVEQLEPIEEFSAEEWREATAHRICELFSPSMVIEAEKMFASDRGRELLSEFPHVMQKLKALEESAKFVSLAKESVQQAEAMLHDAHIAPAADLRVA